MNSFQIFVTNFSYRNVSTTQLYWLKGLLHWCSSCMCIQKGSWCKTALYTPRGPGILLVVYDLRGQGALVVSLHYMQLGYWCLACLCALEQHVLRFCGPHITGLVHNTAHILSHSRCTLRVSNN